MNRSALDGRPAHRPRQKIAWLAVAWTLCLSGAAAVAQLHNAPPPAGAKPLIRKLGTIDVGIVETTPFVFAGRLYRFESDRFTKDFRIVDVAGNQTVSHFAPDHAFGCAYVDGGIVWVFGVAPPGGSRIDAFWSKDLKTWQSTTAFTLPGWSLFNTSVCKDDHGFLMAIEVGGPGEIVGTRFTNRFMRSKDLRTWELVPEPAVFTKDRYSACPTIRFFDGVYYLIYLEQMQGWNFEAYIARSRDLIRWELSPRNPFLRADDADKTPATALTDTQRKQIATATDINNSDVDLCEFGGKVIINYSWGNQSGNEFLAQAEFPGTLKQFLKDWFAE